MEELSGALRKAEQAQERRWSYSLTVGEWAPWQRDRFLDAAFEVAGVPLIRFKAQARYDVAVIRESVFARLVNNRAA